MPLALILGQAIQLPTGWIFIIYKVVMLATWKENAIEGRVSGRERFAVIFVCCFHDIYPDSCPILLSVLEGIPHFFLFARVRFLDLVSAMKSQRKKKVKRQRDAEIEMGSRE